MDRTSEMQRGEAVVFVSNPISEMSTAPSTGYSPLRDPGRGVEVDRIRIIRK